MKKGQGHFSNFEITVCVVGPIDYTPGITFSFGKLSN